MASSVSRVRLTGAKRDDSSTFRSRTNSRTAKPVLRQVLLTGGEEEGMRDGEEGRAKECIGRYKKGVKAGAVVDEIGPRTSERAVIYVAGNIGRPVPAVLVIYST